MRAKRRLDANLGAYPPLYDPFFPEGKGLKMKNETYVIKLNSAEHSALCALVQERCRQYSEMASIEDAKLLEDNSMFCSVILAASRKAKKFELAYQSLLDSLMRFEVSND